MENLESERRSQRQFEQLAALKEEAENRLYRRIDFSMRIGRLVYGIIVLIIIGTAWIVALQIQVRYNTHAIEKVWQQAFGYPLP